MQGRKKKEEGRRWKSRDLQLLHLGIIHEGRSLWADSRDKFQEKYVPLSPPLRCYVHSRQCPCSFNPGTIRTRESDFAATPYTGMWTLMRKISKRRSTAANCLVKLPKCSGHGHYTRHPRGPKPRGIPFTTRWRWGRRDERRREDVRWNKMI